MLTFLKQTPLLSGHIVMVPATCKRYIIKTKPTLVFVSKVLAYGRCCGFKAMTDTIGGPNT